MFLILGILRSTLYYLYACFTYGVTDMHTVCTVYNAVSLFLNCIYICFTHCVHVHTVHIFCVYTCFTYCVDMNTVHTVRTYMFLML